MQTIQSIRGMNDILPADTACWSAAEAIIKSVVTRYGFQEIRFPIVEKTELFKRSIGEVTDIVEKEMYAFEDRNGDSLALRPEGTAGCVRACLENGLLAGQLQRFWYSGPMFRHERPQKGRYRQFHQIGLETFGMEGPLIDVELLLICQRIWQALELDDRVQLQLNSLGSPETRKAYRQALVDYLCQYKADLDEDSMRRLETNPLRILDSKNPKTQELVVNAPKLVDFFDGETQQYWDNLLKLLDDHGVSYQINTALVRGLDYYSHTVFEWVTNELGAQGTVCAGGRYDGLVELLGGKHTAAIGCAFGMERLVMLLSTKQFSDQKVDVYLVSVGEAAQIYGQLLAERIRNALPEIHLLMHAGAGNFKSQLKKADKSGADYAIILGENELENQQITLKSLRKDINQQLLSEIELIKTLTKAYTCQF